MVVSGTEDRFKHFFVFGIQTQKGLQGLLSPPLPPPSLRRVANATKTKKKAKQKGRKLPLSLYV
jgi:hypothetical protein